MQAGHMVVSFHLLQRTRTGVLDTFIHRGNSVGTSESGYDVAVVRVKSRSRVSRRVRRSENPSGQSPRLLALLMCPASPIITNSLPHAVAKACARMTVTNGSFELATTTLGNGNRTSGIGANPVGPEGKFAASGSLGATRSAPRTLPSEQPTAQCAPSAHPALCATSKVSGPVRSSA